MVKKRYLLDTNVLSEVMKTTPSKLVLKRLERHQHEIVTAAPVWHELQYGCHRLPASRKRQMIEAYLDDVIGKNLVILPYDGLAAAWHARERACLASKGKAMAFTNGQIAAVAKVNELVLVTRNTKDFKVFSGLNLQNWHAARVSDQS